MRPEEIEWRQGEGGKPHAVRAGAGSGGPATGCAGRWAEGPMRRKEMRCKKCLQILKAMERWEKGRSRRRRTRDRKKRAALPCGADFQICRIADFQSARPRKFLT